MCRRLGGAGKAYVPALGDKAFEDVEQVPACTASLQLGPTMADGQKMGHVEGPRAKRPLFKHEFAASGRGENTDHLVAQLIDGERFADDVHTIGSIDVLGIAAGKQYR